MKSTLKETLETAVQDWAEDNSNSVDWPDGSYTPELVGQMATAAEAVFDANFRGQEFAKQEASDA